MARINEDQLDDAIREVDRLAERLGYLVLEERNGSSSTRVARLDWDAGDGIDAVRGWLESQVVGWHESSGGRSLRLKLHGPKGGYLASATIGLLEDDEEEQHDASAALPEAYTAEVAMHTALRVVTDGHAGVARREAALFTRALEFLDRLSGALASAQSTIEALAVSRFQALERELTARAEAAQTVEREELAERVVDRLSDTALTLVAGAQGLPPDLAGLLQRPDVRDLLNDDRVKRLVSNPEQLRELVAMLPEEPG